MATRGWDDARATARLLVRTTLECLRDINKAPDAAASLNNVYRLLEAYRVNPFFGYIQRDVPEGKPDQDAVRTSIRDRHLSEVRTALEEAVNAVFQGESKDAAVQAVENVLRQITYPQHGAPSTAERERVTRFFQEVSQRLTYA